LILKGIAHSIRRRFAVLGLTALLAPLLAHIWNRVSQVQSLFGSLARQIETDAAPAKPRHPPEYYDTESGTSGGGGGGEGTPELPEHPPPGINDVRLYGSEPPRGGRLGMGSSAEGDLGERVAAMQSELAAIYETSEYQMQATCAGVWRVYPKPTNLATRRH